MSDGQRVAIITGGSSGIGLATAARFATAGYDVVLTARRAGPLRSAADELGARWVAADAADPEAFAAVVETAGHVDVLVHAAGAMAGTFVRAERIETFDQVLRANLRSAFVTSAAVVPVMPAGGRVVFLGSSSASDPQPGKAAYSASKAGLEAYAAALAGEVERDGIAVHVVRTGPVATPMLDDVHFPMRTLQPDDVADAIVWLDTLGPSVRLPLVALDAVGTGPFAPDPFVPEAARARGRTTTPN